MSDFNGWLGVDLDGTMAEYDGWRGTRTHRQARPREIQVDE
jgi:hypothetical protein